MDIEAATFQNKGAKEVVISDHEIRLIFGYIIPKAPQDLYAEKYVKGVKTLQLVLLPQDELILKFILKNENFISFVDCGLRLFLKESVLKKRFSLAVALVESSPESFDLFLNTAPIRFPKLSFFRVGVQTGFTMMVAFFLFKLKGWK